MKPGVVRRAKESLKTRTVSMYAGAVPVYVVLAVSYVIGTFQN